MAARNRGFTLIELVFVLAIAGILMAIAIPRIDTGAYRADAAAQSVRSLLQQAQRAALERQYDIYVLFDTTAGEMTIAEDANHDTLIESSEHIRRQLLYDHTRFHAPAVGIDSAVSTPIAASKLHHTNGLPSVVFHRDGAASANLDIYLDTPGRMGDVFRAVRLNQATGATSWYRFNGHAWVSASY